MRCGPMVFINIFNNIRYRRYHQFLLRYLYPFWKTNAWLSCHGINLCVRIVHCPLFTPFRLFVIQLRLFGDRCRFHWRQQTATACSREESWCFVLVFFEARVKAVPEVAVHRPSPLLSEGCDGVQPLDTYALKKLCFHPIENVNRLF